MAFLPEMTEFILPRRNEKRFIAWQGMLFLAQGLFSLLPVVLTGTGPDYFGALFGIQCILASTAVLVPQLFNLPDNYHLLPFFATGSCALAIYSQAVHPGVLLFLIPWILNVTLGERRRCYNQYYLVAFMVFTMGVLSISVLYFPDSGFPNSHVALIFSGGLLLSVLQTMLLIGELQGERAPMKKVKKSKVNSDSLETAIQSILAAENNLENTLWRVSQKCIPLLGLEDCVIYLYREEDDTLVQVAAYGNKAPGGSEIVLSPIEIRPGKGVVGTCFASGKALRINDLSTFEGYIVDDAPRNSELAVPILSKGRVVGVIDSEHTKRDFFSKDHEHAFELLAEFCGEQYAANWGAY